MALNTLRDRIFTEMKPSQETLEKYADLLINFALNSGAGIKKGELVFLQVPECAKPLLKELQISVLKAKAHYITQFIPDDMARIIYEHADSEQLAFFPDKYLKGRVDQADHFLSIIAETNKHELNGISPHKIMARSQAFKPYADWRNKKENLGEMTWTLALYGTEAMAREAGMTIEDYWSQIIKACYLDEPEPIAKWRTIFVEIDRLKNKLNELQIEKIKIISKDTNLFIGL